MQLRATLRLDPDAEQRLVERLRRDRFVQVAYLFGSGVRQRLRFDSDLDVGVASSLGPLSPAEMRGVAQQIAEITGRAADVVDLASASAPMLRAAMVEGRQLFCLDRALLLTLQRRLVYETEDFLPYQRRLLDERRRRWIGT